MVAYTIAAVYIYLIHNTFNDGDAATDTGDLIASSNVLSIRTVHRHTHKRKACCQKGITS